MAWAGFTFNYMHLMKKIIITLLFQLLFAHAPNAQIISTIAGVPLTPSGFSGDGGPATLAKLNNPCHVTFDKWGNHYIVDAGNHAIRKISPSGTITTIAGTGTSGYNGDGGPATAAMLHTPANVAVDTAGNIYITDQGNRRIRKIDPLGIITTFAGNGTNTPLGEGGAATAAATWGPYALFIDKWGNIFYTDHGFYRIRKIDPSGIVTTICGTGVSGYTGDGGPATAATLWRPTCLTGDTLGNIYVGDESNFCVRRINSAGIITTVAGTGTSGYSGNNGPATAANFSGISGIAMDSLLNLYVLDYLNYEVRKVNPFGIVYRWAGNGTLGYSGDGGPATSAGLSGNNGLCSDRAGTIHFATTAHTARRVSAPPPVTITGHTTLCITDTLTFTASTPGGVWSSSTPAIATVSAVGLTTALSTGTTIITYMAAAGTAFYTVSVAACPTSIIPITSPANTLTIVPNPSTGNFTIHTPGLQGNVALSVADATGRTVHTARHTIVSAKLSCALPPLAPGSYTLSITSSGNVFYGRLLISSGQ